jgi:signal transduction histidine kinase
MTRIRSGARGRASIRTRLMILNVGTLALILTAVGGLAQYMIRTGLLASVDQDLAAKASAHPAHLAFGPNPPGLPGGGPFYFGPRRPYPPGEVQPPIPTQPGGPPGAIGAFPGEPQPGNSPREQGGPGPGPGPSRLAAAALGSQDLYGPKVIRVSGPGASPEGPDDRFPGWPPRRGGPPFQDKPIDAAAFAAAARGQRVYSTKIVDGSPVRVLSDPIRRRGVVVAVLQLPYPLAYINEAIDRTNSVLLTLIPLALLLAGLAGWLLTDRAIRPVREMALAAGRIGEREISQRLPVTGQDEFSRLAVTFNGVLARLETAFRRQAALIEQERRFTADASHELKTPLTIIKANSSLMLQMDPSRDELHEMAGEVDRAADAMGRLVQDLLLLARFDAGQLGRNVVPLSVADVVAEAVGRARPADGIRIVCEVPDGLTVPGNRDELARLLCNLIENAVRYSPPDGDVRISGRQEGEAVAVSVSDGGPGIAPEHLPHLGERFYRVDAARARPDGGTGLGLSICKSIVEAHHGAIRFDSVVGQGTTVTVRLPLQEGRAPESAE